MAKSTTKTTKTARMTRTKPVRRMICRTKHAAFDMAVILFCSLPHLGAFALVTPTSFQRGTSSLHSSFFDGGWDNDNFLDSLNRGNSESDTGGGNEASERANDEYWEQSKYGRSPPWAESNNPPKAPPTPTKLSYAEALRQSQQQKIMQQQKQEDLTAVSDAADEVYAYSYNKHAKAPPTNTKLSYAESLKQNQQQSMQQQQQQQQPDLTSVSDAAAETYAYSYNKEVDAPVDESAFIDVDPSERVEIDATKKEPIPKHLVEKAKASHEDDKEEASQGGSRFRELIEKAKEKAREQPPPPPPPTMGPMDLQLQLMQEQVALLQENIQRLQQQNQVPNQSVPQQQMQQQEILQQQQKLQKEQEDLTAVSDAAAEVYSYSYHKKVEVTAKSDDSVIPPSMIMTPEEIATLSVEEQARLYREFFYVQQHKKRTPSQEKSMGSTSQNYLQAGIGFDGKKIGSNRDADVISNTSDAYFAQLKRDSTTRNLARYSGDNVKANDVFHDPAIQDIKVPVNPYLKDQQRRMRDVIDTVPEEMLLFQEFDDDADKMSKEELASYTGVSYKEKMEQKRREREQKRRNGQ